MSYKGKEASPLETLVGGGEEKALKFSVVLVVAKEPLKVLFRPEF